MTNTSLSVLGVLLGMVVGSLSAGDPAFARDRPGTPDQVEAYDCSAPGKAQICVNFRNTAKEDVWLEVESNPTWSSLKGKVICERSQDNRRCWRGTNHPRKYADLTWEASSNSPFRDQLWMFRLQDVAYDTQYCFRLRTRRVDNDVVSEILSASACGRTRKAPPLVTPRAAISVKFLGTQWLSNPRRQIPEKLLILAPRNAGYTLSVNDQPSRGTPDDPEGFIVPIKEGMDQVKIQLCQSMGSARACDEKIVSVSKQEVAQGQEKIDRPGGDYLNFQADAVKECEAACGRNSMCRAWTWVKPGVQGTKAVCYLKKEVPKPVAADCCTSGVK